MRSAFGVEHGEISKSRFTGANEGAKLVAGLRAKPKKSVAELLAAKKPSSQAAANSAKPYKRPSPSAAALRRSAGY